MQAKNSQDEEKLENNLEQDPQRVVPEGRLSLLKRKVEEKKNKSTSPIQKNGKLPVT